MAEIDGNPVRYEIIANALRRAISSGTVPAGLVLLEAPLAKIFGTSRVPVRQALALLSDENLICRFSGRGFLIGPASACLEPLRRALQPSMFPTEEVAEVKNIKPAGNRLFDGLYAELSAFVLFGRYRVDEKLIMDAFGVGRNVVREALVRLADHQLIVKEPYGQWFTVALTARALIDEFEICQAFQPDIISVRANDYALTHLHEVSELIARAKISSAQRDVELAFDYAERFLFSGLKNRKIQALLDHCRSATLLDRFLRRAISTLDSLQMLSRLELVLVALLAREADEARSCYREYLAAWECQTLDRLKVLAVLPEPASPDYLIKT